VHKPSIYNQTFRCQINISKYVLLTSNTWIEHTFRSIFHQHICPVFCCTLYMLCKLFFQCPPKPGAYISSYPLPPLQCLGLFGSISLSRFVCLPICLALSEVTDTSNRTRNIWNISKSMRSRWIAVPWFARFAKKELGQTAGPKGHKNSEKVVNGLTKQRKLG